MHGGGEGCTYPEDKPSHRRVLYHQLVFYGFLATFISTVFAAILQDIFEQLPPYPYWSAPVVFGTVGGVMQIVGCGGLLALKYRAIKVGTPSKTRDMDTLFLVLLLLVNINGLLLLALRDTQVMGFLLALPPRDAGRPDDHAAVRQVRARGLPLRGPRAEPAGGPERAAGGARREGLAAGQRVRAGPVIVASTRTSLTWLMPSIV